MKYIGMFIVLALMFIIGLSDIIIFKIKVWLNYKHNNDAIKNYLSPKDYYIYKNNSK